MLFKLNAENLLHMKTFSQDIWAKLHLLFYDILKIFTRLLVRLISHI